MAGFWRVTLAADLIVAYLVSRRQVHTCVEVSLCSSEFAIGLRFVPLLQITNLTLSWSR